MAQFRKKPVVIEAVQWNGGEYEWLSSFCGQNWGRADAVGEEYWPSDIPDKEQVVVYNTAQRAWLPVPVGHWIIRGIRGELYPCEDGIFEATYDPVAAEAPRG